MEQTRVYQNQPDDQSPPDPNPPVQLDPRATPKSPPRPKPGVKKKISQSGSKPDVVGQNLVEEDQRVSTRQGPTNVGLDGNGAIWVGGFTEQPGFLFPAARPTSPPPPPRRQITEEASLSVTPKQVVATFNPSPSDRRLPSHFPPQVNGHGLPDQDPPSLQPDIFPPPVEDVQVTDVFYEDTFKDSGLQTTIPGQTRLNVSSWSKAANSRTRQLLRCLLSTGAGVDSVSSSAPEDDAASVNPPRAEADASAPSNGSSPWVRDRGATRSNTLAGSVYKSLTSPSLLRVLVHTTQPMFTGTE